MNNNCNIKSSEEYENEFEQIKGELTIRISTLKKYEDIELSAPLEIDDQLYIPIEGTFNKKFFVRLYILRNHIIEKIIVSKFNMLQFQIPVKADNEELILLVYGTHILNDYYLEDDKMSAEIGESLCDNRIEIEKHSLIARCINRFNDAFKEMIRNNVNPYIYIKNSRVINEIEVLKGKLLNIVNDYFKKATNEYMISNYKSIKWVNEYRLFNSIKVLYPDAIFQFFPYWLDGQSIDIYIPSKKMAIEYQGEQHFKAIDFFGGKQGLNKRFLLDDIKKQKCNEHDIELHQWSHKKGTYFREIAEFFGEDNESVLSKLKEWQPRPVTEVLSKAESSSLKAPKIDKNRTVRQATSVIRKYDLNGNFVSEYKTLKEASESSGIGITSIFKCLNGQRKTAKKYIWRREDIYSIPIPSEIIRQNNYKANDVKNESISKAVFQIDCTTGEIIKSHTSINAAARSTGINRNGIYDVIHGKQKTAGGFFWRLID